MQISCSGRLISSWHNTCRSAVKIDELEVGIRWQITVVPLQVSFSGSLVKIEIGLAKGKKLYDKRETIAKKDQKREAQREFKAFNR